MKKRNIQIIGTICWLPPHKPNRKRFPPDFPFLAIGRFTSDLSGDVLETYVNYSPSCENDNSCFKVRLHYRTLEGKKEELEKKVKNSEVLIMDAYKVIAVCRNLSIPDDVGFIDDNWEN
ncbi:MAG: hypothetical protein JEZ06_23570 [Anaerolineaceae bacterium]|nr:hypothetical protein [Anaerolineaceae bacterium]